MCWIVLLGNWAVAVVTRNKLKRSLKNRHPNLRANLGFFEIDLDTAQSRTSFEALYKLLTSFGSRKEVKSFWGQFVDVKAIENGDDTEVKKLLNRTFRLTSNHWRIWIVMIIAFLLAALSWPK